MLYDEFKPIVDLILNNWTALQLAVEHGMGAPGGEKTAQLMSVYVARYCVENVVSIDDLTELLEDLMDEEFDTVCQDNSTKEIASYLLTFLTMLQEGRHDELRATIEAMPKCQKWLSQPVHPSVPLQYHGNPDDDTTSSSSEDNDQDDGADNEMSGDSQPNVHPVASSSNDIEPMEEDVEPGWTVVRTRRRK